MDAGDEFVLVEGFGEIVVRSEAQALDLVLDPRKSRENENRRLDLGDAKRPQHLIARHVREIQIEQDNVVVVEFAEIYAFLAEIGRIDIEVLGLKHELNALSRRAVIFD